MDRRQPHRRQPVPGPRLRGVGGLQRLSRSRSGWRSPATAGQTFAKAVTITPPSAGRRRRHLRLPGDRRGRRPSTSRSSRSRRTAAVDDLRRTLDRRRSHVRRRSSPVATVGTIPTAGLPNTRFRDGIIESFAASPTYPGHLYLTYEDWDGAARWTSSSRSRPTAAPLVGAGRGQRQRRPAPARRPTSSSRRSRPARAARWPSRSTTGAAVPERPERPARGRRAHELLHRHLAAGVQGLRQRRGAGRSERADLAVHLGSGAAGPAPRRPLTVPVRRRTPTPARTAQASSATTSGSRSPARTSTRCSSRPTTRPQ